MNKNGLSTTIIHSSLGGGASILPETEVTETILVPHSSTLKNMF